MPYTSRVLFIRHAYSCSNSYHYYIDNAKTHIPDYHRYVHLTELGRTISKTLARKKLAEVLGGKPEPLRDYVVCSAMLRAIETAALMHPGMKIRVYPYLAEQDSTPSDVPKTCQEYADILSKKQYKISVDLSRITDDKGNILKSAVQSNMDKFMELVLYDIDRKPEYKKHKPRNIIIVTHSHLIHDQVRGPYLYNNGIVEQYWHVKHAKSCILSKPRLVWDGKPPPKTYAEMKKFAGMCGCDNKLGDICVCPDKKCKKPHK